MKNVALLHFLYLKKKSCFDKLMKINKLVKINE